MTQHEGQATEVDREEIERRYGRLIPPHDAVDPEVVNREIHYIMYSVFATTAPLPQDQEIREQMVRDARTAVQATGVIVRGWYDVGGLRADADLMGWWHADSIEKVQAAYQALRASDLGRALEPVWSNVGMHRPAEFNKAHLPGMLMTPEARNYLAVYPFVRSYDWYTMEPAKRSGILRDHGKAGREFPDVLFSTVSAFGLGDYEFLLAAEADTLHRIVDLMRAFRNTEARHYVREEIPFYTGPRVELTDWAGRQPLL